MKWLMSTIIWLLMIIAFAGCGKINMGSNTTINQNGSGKFVFKVIYDSAIASLLKNESVLNADGDVLPKGEIVRKYMENGNYVEDYAIDFSSLQDLNKKFSTNKSMKVSIKEERGFLHSTYTYEMRFPNGFIGTDIKASSTSGENISTAEKKTAIDYTSSIPFINQVTLPGKLIKTNAIEGKGNNLVWTYSLGQLTPDVKMIATYTLNNRANLIMLYVIGAASAIGALVSLFIIIRRQRIL